MSDPRILVVEDDERTRRLLCDVLEVNGFAILATESGLEAVDIVRREPLDLVIMDIHLPDLDGMQAMRRIRELEPARGLPVVALTASAMPEERREIMSAGFTAYRSKPIDVRHFLDTVREMLAGAAAVASRPGES